MLEVSDVAPDFSLPNQNGVIVNLADYLGQKVVVFFYLKDKNGKCTKEACSFRDHYHIFMEKNVEILGISFDNKKSHRQFIDKFNLPFQLLSDINTSVATQYGVYGEKKLYGRKYMSIHRTTFLIDENGIIQHVFNKVRPAYHAQDILKIL
jgi:peroxiredoxin Q/BCP